jgi:hypothetical protein
MHSKAKSKVSTSSQQNALPETNWYCKLIPCHANAQSNTQTPSASLLLQ